MKQLSLFLVCLFFTVNTQAQNAEAQLLFEEAEMLYEKYTTMDCVKNQQDCLEVLTQMAQKVDGAEKIVGEKPKIVYLSALAMYKTYDLFDYANNLYDDTYGEGLFKIAYEARKSAKRYLELKQNDELDDRYREMRKIVTELEQYPKDKAAWLEEKEKRERVAAEKIKIKEEKKQKFLSQIKEYDQNKDQYYRIIAPKIDAWEYKDGIKIGMDFDELKKTKKDWFKGHKTSDYSSYYKKFDKSSDDRLEKVGTQNGSKNEITYYKFSNPNPDAVLAKLKEYFGENLVFETINSIYISDNYISQNGGSDVHYIKSPYSENVIEVYYNSDEITISKINNLARINEEQSKAAIDPKYLDRYVGTYLTTNGNTRFTISNTKKSMLELKSDYNTAVTFYLIKEENKDDFVVRYYTNDSKFYTLGKKRKYRFDLEKGMLVQTEDGKEIILTKEY